MESLRILNQDGKEHFKSHHPDGARMNTNGTPSLTKDGLRRSIREALRTIPIERRTEWSSAIRSKLQEHDFWIPPPGGVVAMFGGMTSEPDLLPLLPWLADRRVRMAFFTITGDVMAPRLVTGCAELHAGPMGVLEPDVTAGIGIPVEKLDAVLLPGVAFNPQNGARLGRGKGHYDRVLDCLPLERPRVGVCFHVQLHSEVPLEEHDRHVQAIVTEREWLCIPG